MSEESIFAAAIVVPDAATRAAFLDRACAGNVELRARLDALVAAHFAADPVLDPATMSAAEFAATRDPDGTRSRTAAAETEGTVIAGRYKLRQQIGEGGMGTVWMADQTEPVKRKVAVKLIRVERGQSKTILARFEAERQAIALMDHPHIAKLLDAGTTETGSPFFVMELVKGVPLTDFCDQHRLTIPERLALFTQICSAVQHAHQKGVIHRDLKPSNILVESHDGKPVPKVIDFGLAKATSGLQLTEHTLFTGFGSVMGTPLYMAPEQATFNAVDIDTRADVYALGVVLYELLTGTTPLTRDTIKKAALDEMLRLVREQEAPTPSSRLSSAGNTPSVAASRQTEPLKLGRFVKGELDWIVLKALSKDRDRRYETAIGFARDVERFLNHEPVQAGPPTTGYRLRKFVRRNRPQVVAAGLVLVALVAGVVGTTAGLIEARKQERAALAAQAAEAERAEGEKRAKELAETKRAEAEQQQKRAEAGEKLAGDRLVQVEIEKKRVEAEKRRADEEKRVAQAVKDFLQTKLLAQADTATQANQLLRGGGLAAQAKYNPTIKELLDRAAVELAADKIEANFPGQPLVQAEILRTVGVAYRGVGEAATGIPFLTRSVELFRQHLGPDHADTLASMDVLAHAYRAAGKLDLALPLLEETLTLYKSRLDPDHPDRLACTNNLALAYQAAGRLDRALQLFEEAASGIERRRFRHEHAQRVVPNAIKAYTDAGQHNKADGWRRKWFAFLKADGQGGTPAYAGELAVWGSSLLGRGQFAEAEPLLRECLAIREAKEPDAWTTFNTQSMLGAALLGQKKYADAEPLLVKGYEGMKAREKSIPPLAATRIPDALDRLIALYTATGKPEEATKYRNLRAKYREVLPPPRQEKE